jgi:hypothetical protein
MFFTNPIEAILFAFFSTLFIELIVAFVLGYRKKTELLAVILVNIITNPLLNYFIQVNNQLKFVQLSFGLILVLEVGVVVVEFALLSFMLKQSKQKILLLAVLMNVVSFGFGVLIQSI